VGLNVAMSATACLTSGVWPIGSWPTSISTSTNRANTCASGRKSSEFAPGSLTISGSRLTASSDNSTKFPWLSTTPLGRPVVPEV